MTMTRCGDDDKVASLVRALLGAAAMHAVVLTDTSLRQDKAVFPRMFERGV